MVNQSIKDAFQRFWEYVIGKIGAHNEDTSAHSDIREAVGALAEQAGKMPTASDIEFADGETFQQKYDSGELKGEDGSSGAIGPAGAGVESMIYNSSTNKWTVTLTDNTTITVDGPAIPDVSVYMPKSGGTFVGSVKASTASTSGYYVRNIKFSETAETPTTEGDICFKLK